MRVGVCGRVGRSSSNLGLEGMRIALQSEKHRVVSHGLVGSIVAAVGAVTGSVAIRPGGEALAITGCEDRERVEEK